MSYLDIDDDISEQQSPTPKRSKGSGGGGSAPSADESGGRSTGPITGFAGGRFGGGKGSGNSTGGGGGKARGAVVKANYTRTGNAKSVKASARYYTTRENEHGEKMEREAFSKDRDELPRADLNERLDKADQEHQYHYRVAVSPGTDREAEGVDLKDYTREVMNEVERQQRGQASWVAVEHSKDTAHTERAHVHVIVSTDEKLNREDLEKVRDQATRSWGEAKERAQTLERDPTLERDMKELAQLREQQMKERTGGREAPSRRVNEPERTQERTQVSTATREDKAPAPSSERERNSGYERDWERDGGRSR